MQQSIGFKEKLEKRCLYSRLTHNGGLDDEGCKCNECRKDKIGYSQWNYQSRLRAINERKARRRAKLQSPSNTIWLRSFNPWIDTMDRGMLDYLLEKLSIKEHSTLRSRNYVVRPKVIYWVEDVPGLRVPIYLNDNATVQLKPPGPTSN